MFTFTGVLNGEAVEEKTVSADQLIELFELNKVVDFKQTALFELDQSGIKTLNYAYNEQTRQNSSSSPKFVSPVINGVYQGQSCTIRYYTSSSVKQTQNGSIKSYIPLRMMFKGSSIGIDPASKKDEVVFWCLYKGTNVSPLRDRFSGRSIFKYVDRNLRTRQEYDKAMGLQSVATAIFDMNPQMAIYIAKGIVVKQEAISRDQCTSDSAAKVALINLLNKYQDDFIKVFNSPETYQIGVAHEFIDKGQISYKPVGETTVFFYTDNGEEIITIASEDAMAGFLNHVKDPSVFAAMCKRLSFNDKPSSEETFSQKLNDAINASLLVIHEGAIYTNTGGIMSQEPVVKIPKNSPYTNVLDYVNAEPKVQAKVISALGK